MPRGPKGENRAADVIGNAIKLMRSLTGDETEELPADDGKNKAAQQLGRKGGTARAKTMSPEQRAEIAKTAAKRSMEDPSIAGRSRPRECASSPTNFKLRHYRFFGGATISF